MPVSAKCCQPGISLDDIDSRRRDATFSEIYELVFYNETMVRSELEVLQLLVKNKLKYHNKPAFSENCMDSNSSLIQNRSGDHI